MKEALFKALTFATKKHQGQFRNDGVTPYIIHPMAVARAMRKAKFDEKSQIVALLHDVLEDTDTTYAELKREFGKDIADVVKCLTRKSNNQVKEYYLKYIMRVKSNSVARAIKIFDLKHNLSDLKRGSMKDKYELALYILNEDEERR